MTTNYQVMPPLSQNEYNNLKLDIEQNGVLVAIDYDEDDNVLDGYHRIKICEELGITEWPRVQRSGMTETEKRTYARKINVLRRQTSREQKQELVHDQLLDTPDWSNRRISELIGISDKTIQSIRKKMCATAEIPQLHTLVGADNRKRPSMTDPITLPDYKITVPKAENIEIYDRYKAGETQRVIAADYKVSRSTITRRIAKVERDIEKGQNKPVQIESQRSPRLILGKAEDMHAIDSETIDLIITSPPYNLQSEHWPMGGAGREPRQGIGYADDLPEDLYVIWQIECLKDMYRVAKPGASLFYNHKVRQTDDQVIHPLDWLRKSDNPWIIRQEIIWDRGSTHNHCPSLFWPHDERIYWMTKGNPVLPEHGMHYDETKDTKHDKRRSTIWRFHGPEADTWHPAPFAEELPERIIEALYRPGMIVLDPFAGSCTTLKVALKYDCDAIGVDMDIDYLTKAKEKNGWTSIV